MSEYECPYCNYRITQEAIAGLSSLECPSCGKTVYVAVDDRSRPQKELDSK
jgi:DNA-directed RNA polymerase subunit RPC12/RpoP